ncbi:uncharacterized protein TNCV_4222701 [Trichonephila clavipes]|nr:uncharacterized protein TNCV_4222701 [Trichonephila clavipes]
MKEEQITNEQQKTIMISILNKYREYFYYYSPRAKDEFGLFRDFIQHCEYYEYLDNFTSFLFFHNFSPLIRLVDERILNIYSNVISSLTLTILSNYLFPKFKHGIHCSNCTFPRKACENKRNSQRFMPFHYRSCFLKNTIELATELKSFEDYATSPSCELLEEMRKSLKMFPEIVDEFSTVRLKSHLDIVTELSKETNTIKRKLTIERTIQVIGEIVSGGKEVSNVVRFLVQCLLPPEVTQCIQDLRDNSLGHYKWNSVQGRINIERNDSDILDHIQKEIKEIAIHFQPVYLSQLLRVEESMIKTGKLEAKEIKKLKWNINMQLSNIIRARKKICKKEKDSFKYLLHRMLLLLTRKIESDNCLQDFKSGLEVLKFLLKIYDHCNECSSKTSSVKIDALQNFIEKLDLQNITEIRNEWKKYFSSYSDILDFELEREPKLNFPFLISLSEKIKSFDIFSLEEKIEIKQKISDSLEKSATLLKQVTEELEKGVVPKDLSDHLEFIILPQNKKKLIILHASSNIKESLNELRCVKKEEINKIFTLEEINMFEKMLLQEELISALLKIKFRSKLKKKIMRVINQKVWFLINRINHLKRILILEDEDISFLWKTGRWRRNLEIEKRIKFLMVRRYMTEKDLRPPLEMLLFDCMNIMNKPKKKKTTKSNDFWIKSNNMFIEANMIHLIAHGNPVESLSDYLYVEDLPSEIINEIFELIKDQPTIAALSEIWEKKKVGKISTFEGIITNKNAKIDECSKLRKKIDQNPKWKRYSNLLPLRQ